MTDTVSSAMNLDILLQQPPLLLRPRTPPRVCERRVIFPSFFRSCSTASSSSTASPSSDVDFSHTPTCCVDKTEKPLPTLPPLTPERLEEARTELYHLLVLAPLKPIDTTNKRHSDTIVKQALTPRDSSLSIRSLTQLEKNFAPRLPKFEVQPENSNEKISMPKSEAKEKGAAATRTLPAARAGPFMSLASFSQTARDSAKTNTSNHLLGSSMCQPTRRRPTPFQPTALPTQSILRAKTYQPKQRYVLVEGDAKEDFAPIPVGKISSIDSDIPSLASTVSESSTSTDGHAPSASSPFGAGQPPRLGVRSKAIGFDPRVWVREFQRSEGEKKTTWYTTQELDSFKMEALKRIMQYSRSEIITTGTGRTICRPVLDGKAVFTHKALRPDAECPLEQTSKSAAKPLFDRCRVVQSEIRNVLLVDPHDICLRLFSKALQNVMPHVSITAATSSEEALRYIEQNKRHFDVVIIEERLKLFHRQQCQDHHASGSMLLRKLSEASDTSLYVGVSAHLGEDGAVLKKSGADFCWAKPPPPLNQSLLDDMLKALLLKRGRQSLANEIFGSL